jgi:Zn-dependent alcohol dehydrogenase
MDVTAALFREAGAPLSVERITLDPPAPTEILVRVAAVGLCRTDYHVLCGEPGGDAADGARPRGCRRR